MKTRFLILAFLSLGLFTACEVKDDSPNDTQQINEELLGIWYFDAMIVQDEEIPYDDHEECGKDYIQFNDDGTYQQVDIWGCEEDIDAEGTYTATENTITYITKYRRHHEIHQECRDGVRAVAQWG